MVVAPAIVGVGATVERTATGCGFGRGTDGGGC